MFSKSNPKNIKFTLALFFFFFFQLSLSCCVFFTVSFHKAFLHQIKAVPTSSEDTKTLRFTPSVGDSSALRFEFNEGALTSFIFKLEGNAMSKLTVYVNRPLEIPKLNAATVDNTHQTSRRQYEFKLGLRNGSLLNRY